MHNVRMFGLFGNQRVYLDYASAPPVLPVAIAAMRAAQHLAGNPGAIHAEGVAARNSLEASRAKIAALLGVKAREIIFTPGLTAANNLGILGFARHLEQTRRTLAGTHWLVSAIEHPSILECFAEVERLGGAVSHVYPDARGILLPETIRRALRPETVFLSVGWANNEIGTVQALGEMAHVLRAHEKEHATEIIFHTDAGQAPLYEPTSAHSLGVDLLSVGANKLYGPHGVGALYVGNRTELAPVVFGGKQERGLWAGTESAALAAGFAAAFSESVRVRSAEAKRLKKLRGEFAYELAASVPGLIVNGSASLTTSGGLAHALPHMLNISIPNTLPTSRQVSTEYLTLALDHEGIAVSTKSACREGEESRSHVVAALGPAGSAEPAGWRAQHTLRFSLGRDTRPHDLTRVSEAIKKILAIGRS